MKVKNKFGFLSLLGLLGFFGLFTDHNLLFLFFGYFGYAYYFNVIPDEMFKEHLLKASSISFLVMFLLMVSIIILVSITRNMDLVYFGFFISFIIGNIVFTVVQAIYEIKESNGAKNGNI